MYIHTSKGLPETPSRVRQLLHERRRARLKLRMDVLRLGKKVHKGKVERLLKSKQDTCSKHRRKKSVAGTLDVPLVAPPVVVTDYDVEMGDRTDTPQSPSGHASLLGEDADMDVDADGLTGWDGFDKDEHATVRDAAGANEAVAGPMAPRPIACDITQTNGFPTTQASSSSGCSGAMRLVASFRPHPPPEDTGNFLEASHEEILSCEDKNDAMIVDIDNLNEWAGFGGIANERMQMVIDSVTNANETASQPVATGDTSDLGSPLSSSDGLGGPVNLIPFRTRFKGKTFGFGLRQVCLVSSLVFVVYVASTPAVVRLAWLHTFRKGIYWTTGRFVHKLGVVLSR